MESWRPISLIPKSDDFPPLPQLSELVGIIDKDNLNEYAYTSIF